MFKSSARDVSKTLLSIVRTRLELFSLEMAEQRGRLAGLLGMLFAALLFLTLALFGFSMLVALYFWATPYRYVALAALVLVYLFIGLFCLFKIRKSLRDGPMPFVATLEELQRDVMLADRFSRGGQDGSNEDAS